MTEQEQINAYLQANPLKKSDKSQDKIWLPPCKACGGKVNVGKKKPLTTFSGAMNSVYTDHVRDFPRHEDEDLCPTCQSKIQFMNSDQNDAVGYLSDWGNKSDNYTDNEVGLYSDNLDKEHLKTAREYEGYESYESMEGTSYRLNQKDGEI